MKKGKRQRRVASPTATARTANRGRFRAIILVLLGMSGWLAALMLGFLELPAKINSFFSEKDVALINLSFRFDKKTYIGRWTNDESLRPFTNMISEGALLGDHGSLQLILSESEGGKIEGEIVCATLFPFTRVFVSGQVAITGGFDGLIWDIVENKRKVLAYFRLEPDDSDMLRFTSDPTFARIIPSESMLWRTSEKMSDGDFRPEYLNSLRRAIDSSRPGSE